MTQKEVLIATPPDEPAAASAEVTKVHKALRPLAHT
jgi:hypothetical protein